MREIEFATLTLFFELKLTVLLLINLTFLKCFQYLNDDWRVRSRQKIIKKLNDCLLNKNTIKSCKEMGRFYSFSDLLSILEEFERKYSGSAWNRLKASVFSKCLSARARRYATSCFWKRRNFSARCFALSPSLEDMKLILQLLDDPVFAVRARVSTAVLVRENKEGIYKILKHMSQSSGYVYSYYRDLLIKGSIRVFKWVEEFATFETNTEFHLACLDVLQTVYFRLKKLNIKKVLNSNEDRLHLAALNLLINNPQPYSMKIIYDNLKDENSDSDVSMPPAVRLKKSEGDGLKVLNDQNSKIKKIIEKRMKDRYLH